MELGGSGGSEGDEFDYAQRMMERDLLAQVSYRSALNNTF
jgi:hypothetical protein